MAGDPSFVFEYGGVDFTTEGFRCDTDHFDAFARFSSDLLLKQARRERRSFAKFVHFIAILFNLMGSEYT